MSRFSLSHSLVVECAELFAILSALNLSQISHELSQITEIEARRENENSACDKINDCDVFSRFFGRFFPLAGHESSL
jgi:hypothetical protein